MALDIASLMGQPHHRNAQVWHSFLRDYTDLPQSNTRLSTNGVNHNLPLPSQPKLVLVYRPRMDERLSWPRRHSKQSAQNRYTMGVAVVSSSNRHASLGNWSIHATSVERRALKLRASMLTTKLLGSQYKTITEFIMPRLQNKQDCSRFKLSSCS